MNKRKEVQSSPVSFAHRALNLPLNFMFKHIFLKYFKKTYETTKPLIIPIGNHWQHGAQGICLITASMFSTAHRRKYFCRAQMSVNPTRSFPWHWLELEAKLNKGNLRTQQAVCQASAWDSRSGCSHCPVSCSDWQWNYRHPELGNLSLAPAGQGEAHWTVFEDLDRSV